jgi:hypothetical protein
MPEKNLCASSSYLSRKMEISRFKAENRPKEAGVEKNFSGGLAG